MIEIWGLVPIVIGLVLLFFVVRTIYRLQRKHRSARIVLDVLGVLSLVPSAFFILIVLDSTSHGTGGTAQGWYLIFSFLSFGLLPLATLLLWILSGRVLYRAYLRVCEIKGA